MAAIEINASSSICRKCGTAYGRLKGYFPVSYGYLYRGTGYLPYCKECVDGMFNAYLAECKDTKMAVRQMCRKLDLYWNERLYESVEKQNTPRSMMTSYIGKINAPKYANKSYDDTLRDESALWIEPAKYADIQQDESVIESADDNVDVPEEVINFWGPGYTPSMYIELEQRRKFWMSKYPDDVELDIGTEALIRQICSLEIDINKARMDGKPIDKYVNSLNNVLGSANLKPVQNVQTGSPSADNTPMGVWIRKWENERPIPEPDPELRDVDKIVRYIQVFFLGHIAKMLGKDGVYSKMYEDEIAKLRVDNPDLSDELSNDEEFFEELYAEDGGDDE